MYEPQLLSLCSRAHMSQLLSSCVATTEAHALKSLCSATREATEAQAPQRGSLNAALKTRAAKNKYIHLKKEIRVLSLKGILNPGQPKPTNLTVFPIVKETESEVAQSYLALCDLVDCNLPGSSIHGIFQARILEWVAISFSRGSS